MVVSVSFQVYVQYADPCMLPNSLTEPGDGSYANKVYTVTGSQNDWTLGDFIVDPAGCSIVYTMTTSPSILASSSALVFDPSLMKLSVFTNDLALTTDSSPWYIEYDVTITATVNLVSTPKTFKMTIENPCNELTLNPMNQADGSI